MLTLIILCSIGSGNAWAADVNMPVSGSQYRFKATYSGTNYYMVAPTTTGNLKPTVTTTEAEGTVFTFTKESNNWYITYVYNNTTYYMYESSSNAQVNITTTKTKVTTVTTNGSYTKIGGTKWIQFNYNSGNCRMGCYSSATGVVLAEAASDPKYTLKVPDGEGGYVTYSNKVKADLTEDMAVSGHSCPGDLDGSYSGWHVGSVETPAASPGTTYNHATGGDMPASGTTLYALFRQNSSPFYWHTNPLCEETKTLSSIAITTAPATTKYLVGETFSSAGAVVTATYSDATTANVSASTTWTSTALTSGSNTITASYTEGGVTKTATTTVTAYTVTIQKKDEDGTTIADAGVTASASGRTLTASAGSTHYVFKTWKYGTASGTSIASATSASTSLTGTPSAAVTVIAEFYKPCTVTWSVNGSTYTTTANVSYNTTTSTPANPSVPGECTGSTFMGWTSNSSWASDSAPGDLFNGTSPTITGNITFYAVFADEN